MERDEEKTAFNARAKASMLEYLKSKTWEEKVESMERMNAMGKAAREAMRVAREKQRQGSDAAGAEEGARKGEA